MSEARGGGEGGDGGAAHLVGPLDGLLGAQVHGDADAPEHEEHDADEDGLGGPLVLAVGVAGRGQVGSALGEQDVVEDLLHDGGRDVDEDGEPMVDIDPDCDELEEIESLQILAWHGGRSAVRKELQHRKNE